MAALAATGQVASSMPQGRPRGHGGWAWQRGLRFSYVVTTAATGYDVSVPWVWPPKNGPNACVNHGRYSADLLTIAKSMAIDD